MLQIFQNTNAINATQKTKNDIILYKNIGRKKSIKWFLYSVNDWPILSSTDIFASIIILLVNILIKHNNI